MKKQMPSVLACVTSQYDCDRIIKSARAVADRFDCELRVLSVIKPMKDYSSIATTLEYLYLISKEAEADMTVLFDDNAPKAVADFATKNNVVRIVTGMHDGRDDSFLIKFNELSPDTSITMISKENKIYNMDVCKCYT